MTSLDKVETYMAISPRYWGLPSSLDKEPSQLLAEMGVQHDEVEERCRRNTYEWLLGQFNGEIGAFHGYYDPVRKELAEPQTVNLIALWQLLAAYDRYGDETLLLMAKRVGDWVEANLVDSHPMSLVLGGVEDNIKRTQLWTKYTADNVVSNIGLYDRTAEERYLHRAIQGGKFLLQSQTHGFCPKYDRWWEQWQSHGWQSFGRAVAANLALSARTGEREWLERALAWAEYGIERQADNGCFHLIHNDYYNSDMAADEIRALVSLYLVSGQERFLQSAHRFADWHLENQRDNGSWLLGVHRSGVPVSDYVGPGDVPNLGVALLLVHKVCGEAKYFEAAVRAFHYSLAVQATPDCGDPYLDDPRIVWGFWSWDPYYDYTMSTDQSTHHVRGLWFLLDYFYSLPEKAQLQLVQAATRSGAILQAG